MVHWPFTISFEDDRTESSTISHLAHCDAYWSRWLSSEFITERPEMLLSSKTLPVMPNGYKYLTIELYTSESQGAALSRIQYHQIISKSKSESSRCLYSD